MSSAAHWTSPPPTYDAPSYMTSTLTPYLQLPHLLSLTWIAYPILSLAFIAFRLQLSLASANDSIAHAKDDLLASCKAAETAATSAASMPRYLAIASNEQFVHVVNGSIDAARETLILALTAMEAIINFIIDIYRSTLLCFLELIVRGALALLIGAVNELNAVINSIASGLSSSIQNDISSANSVIQSAINGINKVNPFGKINAPQIPVPDLSALQNVTLPASFTQALSNLNNSLPTVAQLKDEIETIIDKPFELLKQDINDTFAGISFNSSILPVPRQNNVVFCQNMDLSVVDDLGHDLIMTAKIGLIILIVLALLLIGLKSLLEWYKWRCMKRHLAYTREAWLSDPTLVHAKAAGTPTITMNNHNLMMLNADSAHPLLTRIANNMSKFLHLSPSQNAHLRWFFHYIFHPPALACLLAGLIGLISVELQLLAMGPLVAKYQERSVNTASNFSNLIATSINNTMFNQSATYANGVNAQVDIIQNTINQGVFGWVNTTTTSLNDTVNNFYDDVQKVVSNLFNGTVFENPAQDFIQCFLGSKVDAIENALTFLHDNLVVNMPRVNETILVLSPESVDEVTTPIATAAIGGGPDGKEGLIEKIVNSYAASLRKERLMFGIFIGLWVVVVLMGLCILFWHSYSKSLMASWGRRRWQKEQRSGIDGIIVPFRMESGANDKASSGLDPPPPKLYNDLPSFTPMPSPAPGGGGPFVKPFAFTRSASPSGGAPRTPAAPQEPVEGWGVAFRDRFVSGQPNKLRSALRKSRGREQLVSNQEPEVVKNLPPSTWVRRMRSFSGNRKNEAVPPPPKLRIDVSRPSNDPSGDGDDTRADSSRWSPSPNAATAGASPWNLKNLRKKAPPAVVPGAATLAPPAPRQQPPLIGPPPPPRHPSRPQEQAALNGPEQRKMPLAALLPTPFAPPLHHGFDDSRYPKLTAGVRSPTPVPTGIAVAIKPPRQLQFQQKVAAAAPPPPSSKYERTTSVPMSVAASVSPITRLLTSVQAGMAVEKGEQRDGGGNPFVTPFDDEHRVEIERPVNTRKSMKTNPFEDGL